MNIKAFMNDKRKISGIATVIVLLALVRSISEPFRLQYYSETSLPFEQVKPFLIAAMVAAAGLFAMTLLSFYKKYKMVIVICILVIIAFFIIKGIYRL